MKQTSQKVGGRRRANSTAFERKRTLTGILFLIPTALLVGIFVVWPLINVIELSFFD